MKIRQALVALTLVSAASAGPAEDIVFVIGADKTCRLDASATNSAIGQSYTATVNGNQLTLVGQDGQGTLTYQRK